MSKEEKDMKKVQLNCNWFDLGSFVVYRTTEQLKVVGGGRCNFYILYGLQ
jgi:hypothetical protein